MYNRILKTQLLSLLICQYQQTGTHPRPEFTGYDEKCRGFHFRSKTSHSFPGFPFIDQLITCRHCFRLMLSIERIFRLYHTCMIYKSFLLRSFNKSIGHIQICHCRIFNWRIFSACSFHTYCCCRNYNVSTFYFRLHSTTGSDSDKSIRSAAIQLFHCNGR